MVIVDFFSIKLIAGHKQNLLDLSVANLLVGWLVVFFTTFQPCLSQSINGFQLCMWNKINKVQNHFKPMKHFLLSWGSLHDVGTNMLNCCSK